MLYFFYSFQEETMIDWKKVDPRQLDTIFLSLIVAIGIVVMSIAILKSGRAQQVELAVGEWVVPNTSPTIPAWDPLTVVYDSKGNPSFSPWGAQRTCLVYAEQRVQIQNLPKDDPEVAVVLTLKSSSRKYADCGPGHLVRVMLARLKRPERVTMGF
jgi:hypothetical protein